MEDKLRKILVKFFSNEDLLELSGKLFPANSEQILVQSTSSVSIINGAITKKTSGKKSAPRPVVKKEWEYHWKDLTKFKHVSIKPYCQIEFNFCNEWDSKRIAELFDQNITELTKSISYPNRESSNQNKKRIMGSRGNPQYPIYIISKGRSKTCITADHLLKMNVPFNIVIEKQEWEDYARIYGEDRLIELDLSFREEYDTYIDNFDVSKSKGSGPARNFVWHHAKNVIKSDWHWIMDDNIQGFYYFNESQRLKAVDGTLFASAEDFVNRYDNIGISGLNYYMFAVPGSKDRPYVSNTKIYSCLLINNHIPIRWAGRYNEDVDICIRALKEGYSTIQFDAFLAKKLATQTMGGGNTDAFYAEEGTLPKSNMLMFNHPDITNVTWRFSRWHHMTNYDIFDKYKDRTIKETILDLNKVPVIDKDNPIIQKILDTDWAKLTIWDDYLTDIDDNLRNEIFKVLKMYRYKKNSKEIVDILTKPRVLNCDPSDTWDIDLSIEDNRIMMDLLNLEDENGRLFNTVDWDSLLHYVDKNKRDLIAHEMIRNKYLIKDYEKFNYDQKEFVISDLDHELHRDSLGYIQKEYAKLPDDKCIPEVRTLFDRRIVNEIDEHEKITNNFKAKITKRSSKIEREHEDKVLMICGDENFNNRKLLISETNKIQDKFQEIINSVLYNVDLLAANYALDNKKQNKEFFPDLVKNGDAAIKITYDDMINYTDEIIIFVTSELNSDLQFLKSRAEELNKQVIVIEDRIASTIAFENDEW